MEISVIIPTRNRRDSIERLLSSVELTDRLSSYDVEVIVVDNGSTDGATEFLTEKSRRWPVMRLLFEDRPGKNYALNKGIRHANGRILCFMDDDIVLDAGWLAALLNDFAITGYAAIQPRVLPGKDPSGAAADVNALYAYNIPVIDYGDRICEIRGLTGVIMAVKRAVIEHVGGYDERLPASGYHGDTDISRRIREAGYSIAYTPHVIAYHELNPNRYGSDYARLSQFRKGLSRSLYGRDSLCFDVLPNLCANVLRYGWYQLLRRPEKIYKTEKRIMKYWGYLLGRLRRRLGREPYF